MQTMKSRLFKTLGILIAVRIIVHTPVGRPGG